MNTLTKSVYKRAFPQHYQSVVTEQRRLLAIMELHLKLSLLLVQLIGCYGQGFDASIPADTTFREYFLDGRTIREYLII